MDDLNNLNQSLLSKDGTSDFLEDLKALVQTSKEARAAMVQSVILRALRPPTTNKRFNEISEPEVSTFEWILRPINAPQAEESSVHGKQLEGSGSRPTESTARISASSLLQNWLRAGTGVFHVVGKPGSGKSTFMKLLTMHPQTRKLLESWAASEKKERIVARFFFSQLGVDDQKTVRGLLRGLTYDICNDKPEIIGLLFPQYYHAGQSWQLAATSPGGHGLDIPDHEIGNAFGRLISEPEISRLFCISIFVDGLDEFEERDKSHSYLATRLQSWVREVQNAQSQSEATTLNQTSIKICISSREYDSITNTFSAAQRLTLHHLTKPDIQALVQNRLCNNHMFQTLQQSSASRCKILIDSITKDANGVFLWVVLLLKWLEDELASGHPTLGRLETIVRDSPSELDDFLRKILESIPKHNRFASFLIFSMTLKLLGWRLSTGNRDSLQPKQKVAACRLRDYLTSSALWKSGRRQTPTAGKESWIRTCLSETTKKIGSRDWRELLLKLEVGHEGS